MKYTYDEHNFYSGTVYADSSAGVSVEPPEAQGKLRPKWNGVAWVLTADYRGTTWFNSVTKKYVVSDQPDDARTAPWVEVVGGTITSSFPPAADYIFDYVTKEWIPDIPVLETKARERRNRFLAASDWTQMPDVLLATKTAWATYRQELRDITAQSGYPTEIIWPTPPQ
jgi:hypothetical protein